LPGKGVTSARGSKDNLYNALIQSLTANSLNLEIQEPHRIEEGFNLVYRELTEKDLSTGEKKVFGRIIDMWATETPEDPYSHSTGAKLIKHAKEDDLSSETVQEILKDLEAKGLIRRNEEKGETFIKYTVEAEHIVKELQKTTYVYEARHFKPPHH
jgi:predicted transcriptional regulator